MSGFIEQRLLEKAAEGTQGGPTWATRQVGLSNGVVRRNASRSRPLYRYVILFNNLLDSDHAEVLAAFNATRGGAYGFRLRDPREHSVTDMAFAVGTGSSQTAQLAITYAWGPESVVRPIRKPVAGVVIKANGVVLPGATVNTTTGIATFTATAGHVITWSGEFDVPVRFETDNLAWDYARAAQGLVLSTDIPLIEDLSA